MWRKVNKRRRRTFDWRSQSEKGVMFHGTFPQMFARFFISKTKNECVFLLKAVSASVLVVVIVLDDDQCQLLLLEIQFGDLGPKEEADFRLALEDEDAGRGQTQRVLRAVFAQHRVHVHAVHVQSLGLVEEGQFGLSGAHAFALFVGVQHVHLELFVLIRHEPEFADEGRRVGLRVVVAHLGLQGEGREGHRGLVRAFQPVRKQVLFQLEEKLVTRDFFVQIVGFGWIEFDPHAECVRGTDWR